MGQNVGTKNAFLLNGNSSNLHVMTYNPKKKKTHSAGIVEKFFIPFLISLLLLLLFFFFFFFLNFFVLVIIVLM